MTISGIYLQLSLISFSCPKALQRERDQLIHNCCFMYLNYSRGVSCVSVDGQLAYPLSWNVMSSRMSRRWVRPVLLLLVRSQIVTQVGLGLYRIEQHFVSFRSTTADPSVLSKTIVSYEQENYLLVRVSPNQFQLQFNVNFDSLNLK